MHTPHLMQVLTQLYLTGQTQLSWSQTTRKETLERMESEDHLMWLSSNSAPPTGSKQAYNM